MVGGGVTRLNGDGPLERRLRLAPFEAVLIDVSERRVCLGTVGGQLNANQRCLIGAGVGSSRGRTPYSQDRV